MMRSLVRQREPLPRQAYVNFSYSLKKGYDVERISGHAIDRQHIGERKPFPIRIRFYIDGYGAYRTSESLYDIGIQKLNEHLKSQFKTNDNVAAAMKGHFVTPKSPEVLAEILGYCLGLIELHVVSEIEDRLRTSGRPMFPNALLVNKSSPLNIDLNSKVRNVLDVLYPIDGDQFISAEYLDARSDSIIFCPTKIDREKQIDRLNREIGDCDPRGDAARILWLK